MLGTAVETRIADVAGLNYVAGAAGFAALRQGDRLIVPQKTPAAFVVVLRQVPGPDLRDTGLAVLHDVVYHLAIITCVRVANDRLGEQTNAVSEQVRQGIKDKLFGWIPDGFDDPFILGPSVLFDFEGGAHWHQDEYITKRLEEPSNG